MKISQILMDSDFYEFTMANGYFEKGIENRIADFEMFFRKVPDGGGFAIMAGVETMVNAIKAIEFSMEDIFYLQNQGITNKRFIESLINFEFKCSIEAIQEGMPVFPGEPLVHVRGPLWQAQLVETLVLMCINHQTLIATKANRIARAANGRAVADFGARRAHSFDAAYYGARAACIGGVGGTATVLAAKDFEVPCIGTMAHSWIEAFENEYEAFKAYAEVYPDNCVLLIDTYNTLKSGIGNAIKVFNDVVVPAGYRPKGVRIDSGDLAYLSKQVRQRLDDAGFKDCKIVISNSLDEILIRDLLSQGAPIDSFGVGERLITAKSEPVFGGVYKLVAIEENGKPVGKIKLSDNTEKITTPGRKKLYRIFDNVEVKALADILVTEDEEIDSSKPYTLTDYNDAWKTKTITNYFVCNLHKELFSEGRYIGTPELVNDIARHCKSYADMLWDELKRFENPCKYPVDLSDKLAALKRKLIAEAVK